jgi:hypothetical protein
VLEPVPVKVLAWVLELVLVPAQELVLGLVPHSQRSDPR